jgi:hypothetical protein
MWGMVGETLRDETHGRMEKVQLFSMNTKILYNMLLCIA